VQPAPPSPPDPLPVELPELLLLPAPLLLLPPPLPLIPLLLPFVPLLLATPPLELLLLPLELLLDPPLPLAPLLLEPPLPELLPLPTCAPDPPHAPAPLLATIRTAASIPRGLHDGETLFVSMFGSIVSVSCTQFSPVVRLVTPRGRQQAASRSKSNSSHSRRFLEM
jgi:hypothetical protein